MQWSSKSSQHLPIVAMWSPRVQHFRLGKKHYGWEPHASDDYKEPREPLGQQHCTLVEHTRGIVRAYTPIVFCTVWCSGLWGAEEVGNQIQESVCQEVGNTTREPKWLT